MRRTTRARRRHGFTLLEIVVAMALTTMFVVFMMRWVGTMGLLAGLGAQRTDPTRAAAVIERRFTADALAATGCDPQRNDGPVAAAGPQRVAFYKDENADGNVDWVLWVLDGDTLYRGVKLGQGGCTFDAAVDQTAVADGVRATNAITPWHLGTPQVLGGNVDCDPTPDSCPWDGIQLRLVIDAGAGEEAPVALDTLAPLNLAASGRPRT